MPWQVVALGGRLYAAPHKSAQLLVVDPARGLVSGVDTAAVTTLAAGRGELSVPQRRVWDVCSLVATESIVLLVLNVLTTRKHHPKLPNTPQTPYNTTKTL